MPGYDGTGPEGRGPYGRGLGPCGQGTPRGFFGFGRGRRGGGRGFWWSRRRIIDGEEDLKSSKRWLTEQLDLINKRLNEIEED